MEPPIRPMMIRKLFLGLTPVAISKSHLPSLDGLRGISILLVVISHTFGDKKPFYNGGFGVSIFFVISGFLITLLLLQEKYTTGSVSLKNFYIRRFLRIFPVAYLYLVVLLVLNSTSDEWLPVFHE